MTQSLKTIADLCGARILGDSNFVVESIATFPKYAKEHDLAFIFPSRATKAFKLLRESSSKVFVFSSELEKEVQEQYQNHPEQNFLLVPRPRFALQKIIDLFAKPRHYPAPGIDSTAVVDPSAIIDPSADIGALVYIGPRTRISAGVRIKARAYIGADVSIGSETLIHSGVVIEDYVDIGSRVIIHPNAVIGSDGYSYVTESSSNLEKLQKGDYNFNTDRQIQHKISSAGTVCISDDVEIGANTVIDRATLGVTYIGEGTKIDNLCQIAHNVEIGKDCLIIANTGIAGSARIGDRVTLAGGVGCADGVEIANDVVVGAYSAVNSNLAPFLPVLGIPAIPYGEFLKRQKSLARLSKYQEEVKVLKAKVEELSQE